MTDFNDTYNKYKFYLLKIIKRYVRDLDVAEDLLQETFIKIWKNDNKFRHESEYKTWITRIAINTALTYLQSNLHKTSNQTCSFDIFNEGVTISHPDYQSPEQIISNEQDLEFASNKLKKLSKEMYDALSLYVFGGFCYADVAAKLRIKTNTIRSRLNRARWLISP